VTVNAADFMLISTKGSKYAHAPNWTPWGYKQGLFPACGVALAAADPYQMSNELSEGKPPCPRCVGRLRWHLEWLGEWIDSYEKLDWTQVYVPDGVPEEAA
jgi:hypothetical protein